MHARLNELDDVARSTMEHGTRELAQAAPKPHVEPLQRFVLEVTARGTDEQVREIRDRLAREAKDYADVSVVCAHPPIEVRS